jgi:choline-sulfatase
MGDKIKKPNLVFILADDLGEWGLGCYGNEEIITPNIDRLASMGVRFENFFCTSPVCSPARASILTGRIPSQHGVHDWIRSGNIDGNILVGEQKQMPRFSDEKKAIEYLKGQRTYTDVLSENHYNCGLSGKWHLGDSINNQKGFSHWFTIARGGCSYYSSDFIENGRVEIKTEYITDLITENALNYIDSNRDKSDPFF